MQEHGDRSVGDGLFGVSAWLHRLPEHINVPYNTPSSTGGWPSGGLGGTLPVIESGVIFEGEGPSRRS
ncbi:MULTISPECIES: hypothetical protein [unclassified Streptomyces]|uniref:hypothetical protein n=1 Tax=unclassified Streptomyces TaxID=2593676 RepID=UPI0037F4618B